MFMPKLASDSSGAFVIVAELEYSLRARRDLLDIADHIAIDRPAAARAMLDALTRRIDALSEFPKQGQAIPALGAGVRRLSVRPYLVIYEHRPDSIRIVRILHAARNWPR